jgi:hypothetical protein
MNVECMAAETVRISTVIYVDSLRMRPGRFGLGVNRIAAPPPEARCRASESERSTVFLVPAEVSTGRSRDRICARASRRRPCG